MIVYLTDSYKYIYKLIFRIKLSRRCQEARNENFTMQQLPKTTKID